MRDDKIYLTCEVCEGSGILYPVFTHTAFCAEIDGCIGPPVCPMRIDKPCQYCLEGFTVFDFAYYRNALDFPYEPEDVEFLGSHWTRETRRKIRGAILALEEEEVGQCYKLEMSMRRRQSLFRMASVGWSIEHTRSIIERAAISVGFPVYLLGEPRLYHQRVFYGNFTPHSTTKYHNLELGAKYRAWKNKVRASNAVSDLQGEHEFSPR